MKKLWIICLLCFFSTFDVCAEESCIGPRAKKIETIERRFHSCLLDFPTGTDSNELMLQITQEKTECLEKTADLIFDGFYSSTKEDKKKQFANFVKAATEQGYNLEIGSDIGKRFHTTIFYELGAANYTYVMLHNLLKSYITYMKSECEELPDKDIKDLD